MTDVDETLTDGVVSLAPYVESDIEPHISGEDDELLDWFGQPEHSDAERNARRPRPLAARA